MTEEIGSIEARITADTSDFTRGLLAAEAEAKAFAFDVNKVGTDTNEFANALKFAERASMDAGKAIQDSAKLINEMDGNLQNVNKEVGIFENVGLAMTNVLAGITSTIATGLPGLALFAAAIVLLTAVVIAAADVIGSLIAVIADMVAPVTLIVGLLGLLGAGFVVAAKRAADGGGKLNEFSKALDTLHSMFDRTSSILAHTFLPYLLQLAHAGEVALNFLDKIAKLPLRQAFQAIDTEGVNLLQKFVDNVSAVVAKPIRLAFQIAFGDSNFSSAVGEWWDRFQNYLFGYTKRTPIELRPGVFKIQSKTVDGIFQPLIDWFNNHDFTKQGHRIGHTILAGFTDSAASHRIGSLLVSAFGDAFGTIKDKFMEMLGHLRDSINKWGQNADHQVVQFFVDAWGKIKSSAAHSFGDIKNLIVRAFTGAVNAVKGVFQGLWNWVKSLFSNPIHLNISVPSLPSIPGSGIIGGITGGVGGLLGHASPAARAQPIHVHLMVGERELGQAIIDSQRLFGRHNAGRMLTA